MTISLSDILGIASIILSIVALFITVIGFFASLKFYRDGVILQESATKALTKIEEKTMSIGQQLTGMFDKTLDAAINNKGGQIAEDFDEISEQLEKASKALVERATSELSTVGTGEKEKIKRFIEDQFKIIADQVNITKENTADIVLSPDGEFVGIPQFESKILDTVRTSPKPLTLKQLSDLVNVDQSLVDKAISKLLYKKLIKSEGGLGKESFSFNPQREKQDLASLELAYQRAAIGNQAPIAKLGYYLKKINPTFDSRTYGYNSLSEYLKAQVGYAVIDNVVGGYNHPIIKRTGI